MRGATKWKNQKARPAGGGGGGKEERASTLSLLTSWVWGDRWGKEKSAEGAMEKGASLFDLS